MHSRWCRFDVCWLAILILSLTGHFMNPAMAAVPAARPYVSPEIHKDGTVTFRILAPKASEVTLEGGWMAVNETIPLIKDDKGLWSVTVGPLRATVYGYWFNLDGAVVLDQANQFVRERTGTTSLSSVDLTDTTPLPWSLRDVPHGVVENHWLKSTIMDGTTRNVWVYLPPGYDAKKRYPIFYLLHGGGELNLSWVESGKANLILDNQIADGKIKPMIVVMPYTGPIPGAAPVPVAPQAASAAPATIATPAQLKTSNYLLKEIMPWAEARYSVLPGRKNRAMAGFSAGGAMTALTGFRNLDLFSQLGIFSAPLHVSNPAYADLAKDPKHANSKLDVLWVGTGKSDPGVTEGLRKFDADMTRDGIRHTYMETEGAHDYAVWRWCLVQFAPLLFRN